MRKVLRVRDNWASIAGLPVSDAAPSGEDLPPQQKYPALYRPAPAPG